ncbi:MULTISPECIES: hypothetical protein [Yersinia]|uniref:hypothetical protein n=1 Tax=Yersinia TaxID=629 RepID=UPI0002D380ED|nr:MULTISPECIES: hypothetical protein [Yersinia]UXD25345.1 hypothetical protein FORC065_2542 [Yersinia enterocolitica]
MKVSVSSLVYQEGGTKRIYTLTDGCTAIEFAHVPGRARFNFFNQHGNAIYGIPHRTAIKKAVDRHKKKWCMK